TAASSSSRTQGLAADDAETTTMTAVTVSRPSSNSFLTRLSPGFISQMSSHGATPISASSRASGSTNSLLSSLACERKARTAEGPPFTSTHHAVREQALARRARATAQDHLSGIWAHGSY